MNEQALHDRARQIAAAPFAYASADIAGIIEELLARVDTSEAERDDLAARWAQSELDKAALTRTAPGMIEKRCKCCNAPMQVRLADHRRGWGKFCSKSCKAREQERRTGQNAAYVARVERRGGEDYEDDFPEGWDGHKDA